MESLVLANIKQRKTRTVISVLGVALGVILISLMGGLSSGMLADRAQRETNVGADIMFRRSGDLTTSNMTLEVQYATELQKVSGIEYASPVGQYIKSNNNGIGFEMVEGINYDSYNQMNPLKYAEGKGLSATGYEVIVDPKFAERNHVQTGSKVDLFGHNFTVAGIYDLERGARIKMPLATLQELTGSEEHCSVIYIKVRDQYKDTPEAVAKQIHEALPGNQVILVRDIPAMYAEGIPQLNKFIQIVIGLSAIVSTLVILLAMYTTITERTREIGILKSMGASKRFIISAIEKEALLICAVGIIVGYVLSIISAQTINHTTALAIDIKLKWLAYSALIGILGGLVGALYPALRAASADPVKALSYE